MTPADREVLQAARVRATRQQPYLAVALHSLAVREAAIGTFAVDRAWRLYVDPARLQEWSVEEVSAVLVHEVWHLLRDHAARAERLGALPRSWNTAADAEINDDLLAAGLSLPGRPVTPARLRQPDGLLAEQYYAALPPARTWTADCGSGADAEARPWEAGPVTPEAPGLRPVQADLVRVSTAREVLAARGTVPGGWARWAEQALAPRVDWRQVLAAGVRAGLSWASGASDYTSSRPSRRAAATPGVVLPALRRPVPRVAVVVDTSASVDDAMLGQALAEVDGVLAAAGVRREAVTVLATDAAEGRAQRVRAASRLVLEGGGGTDLRRAVGSAAALRPRPHVLVVLTDGRTPWPDAPPPGTRVVVALLEDSGWPVPGWAAVARAHEAPPVPRPGQPVVPGPSSDSPWVSQTPSTQA